ncbi:ArsA family ATPase [Streptomyces sp. URMC 123]|uniref:ArsA family ATPase n=1 Tax=Streptomyces sp. URMC 123 TaxID=3423403 RepID=UPI003F1DCA43
MSPRTSQDESAPAAGAEATGAEASGTGPAGAGAAGAGPAGAPVLELDPVLDDPATRIVVCCGAGGVGKTTTAAALGLRAAERGRRVVVLTIDPARRLAQSMGIASLDNTPRRVAGIDGAAGGELHAMMLDMKRTFDEIVEAHADADRARAILENPFYQSLSAGFAGTQEYMAMEKLGQLRARDEWDLIVVDTPPSRSALDFLDAPKRLGSFLDGRFIKLLMAPAKIGGRAGMKFLNVGMSMMTGTLNKLMGAQLLRDVQTFVAAMDTMFGGFRTRADATYRLLQAPGTAFLVVAAPERDALREAAYFVERLGTEKMPLAGLVLNRVHGSGAAGLSAERALAAAEELSSLADGAPLSGPDENPLENLSEARIVDQTNGQAAKRGAHTPVAPGPQDPGSGSPAIDPDARDLAEGATDLTAHRNTTAHTTAAHGTTAYDDTAASDVAASGTAASGTVTSGTTAHADSTAYGTDNPTAEQLAAGLLRLHAERMQVLARERRTRDRFTALHPEVPVVEVAALPGDVHDLAGLRAIGERLADPR